MATKILGDDPFGDAPAPKPEPKVEAKPEAKVEAQPEAKPEAKKEPKPRAKPAEPKVAAPPVAAPPVAEPAPPPAKARPETPGSAYGPSIDARDASRPSPRIADDLRGIQDAVKHRLATRDATGEHAGERQSLPLEFLWRRWQKIAMRDRSDVVDEFGRDPHVAARVDPILSFLYKSYFRVEASGLGHIPDEGRALIVANHSGTLPYDGAMIMHAVRSEHAAHRDVRPLVEDFVFHFPYLGTLMNRIGGVRACPENAARLLEKDQLVAVFPEGIKGIGKLFRDRYQLQRFGRGGFIKLALKTDAPIIPTAVVGAEEIHPMLRKLTWLTRTIGVPYIPITPTFPALGPLGMLPLPSKWYIVFGEPLYFNAEYGKEGANDRILVNRLAEQVRIKIQDMLDVVLNKRQSVFFG